MVLQQWNDAVTIRDQRPKGKHFFTSIIFASPQFTCGDAHQGRIPSTYRPKHMGSVPGPALLKLLDTHANGSHTSTCSPFFSLSFFGRASPSSAGESVTLWLPFIKRQGYCGSGLTAATAVNKQGIRGALMNMTRLPGGNSKKGGKVKNKTKIKTCTAEIKKQHGVSCLHRTSSTGSDMKTRL